MDGINKSEKMYKNNDLETRSCSFGKQIACLAYTARINVCIATMVVIPWLVSNCVAGLWSVAVECWEKYY